MQSLSGATGNPLSYCGLCPSLHPLYFHYGWLTPSCVGPIYHSCCMHSIIYMYLHTYIYSSFIYSFSTEYTSDASFRSVESSIHWWNPWFWWSIPPTIRLGRWARSGRCTMHTIGPAQGVASPWRGEDPWSWKNIGLVAVEYPHICVIT